MAAGGDEPRHQGGLSYGNHDHAAPPRVPRHGETGAAVGGIMTLIVWATSLTNSNLRSHLDG